MVGGLNESVAADVLGPQVGVRGLERSHHLEALGVVEDDDLDPVFGQPVVAAVERRGFTDDDAGDAELADQT